ncbi:MAG TPA: ABC transporter permease [Bryobacteraceae bacterium]
MRLSKMFRLRLRSLFSPNKVEQELGEELRYHLQRQIEEEIAAGKTPEEARYAALRSIAAIEQRKEECRDMRGMYLIETLLRDLRYAARSLRKSPGFTFVALFTLALGIGATTAIFSVVYGVLLRPLPYKNAARLIVLHETTPKVGTVSVSYPNFLDWRAQNHVFSEMATVAGVAFNLAGIAQPQNVSGEAVSPNFLSMLGVHPLLGRDFDPSEEKPGTPPVVLLSYQLWQSHFGGNDDVIGHVITLDGRGFTILGVLPPDFRWIEKTDVLEPIGVWATNNPASAERGERGETVVVGRLSAGVSFAQACSEMKAIAARLAHEYPSSNDQFGVALRPIRDVFVGNVRPAILVLLGAVIFVLLIACANVANLFLMRGASRSKEIALRIAIGASRGRIIRQMLTESFLLALLGGLLGLMLAIGGIAGIAQLIPTGSLGGATVNLNVAVLLFAAGMAILSVLIFGLAPAIHSAKADVQSELKEGGRTASSGAKQNRWRGRLVIAEISLALILLVGAGLMMKSLYRLLSVDPGFQPDRVLTMEMSLRTSQYDKDSAILNFWNEVLSRVRALPGVKSAALGTNVPLTNNHWRDDITVDGMPLPRPGSFPHPDIHVISPGYVSTLGIPLLRGHGFTRADNENAPRIGMINARLARRYFPGENPVGRRFHLGHHPVRSPRDWITVVGVVGDTKLYGLANPSRLEVYVPFRQQITSEMNLIVKSGNNPAALTSAIRHIIGSIDKDQPIFGIATMGKLVAKSVSTRRMTLVLLGLFSALALSLAAIGIYGVIAYSVAQRTHEIGIRMALGAQRGDVLRMIFAQGAKIAGIGLAIGIALALGLTRLMGNLLFSVSAADPFTFAAVAIVIALITMLACYLPARRAVRVDPMLALRHE